MRDQFLFALVPWFAALCCLVTAAVRYLQQRQSSQLAAAIARPGEPGDGPTNWWRYSIAVVLAGHVLAIALPGTLLLWNRNPVRLIALESTGVIAGSIAVLSVIATVARRRWWTDRRRALSAADVIAGTLIVLELVSGLAIALRYRWASSWSAVTLTPYLYSLLGLNPAVALVARMPFLVKLHVFGAFAILAVMPLTGLARAVLAALRDLTSITVRPVALVRRPVSYARRAGAARMRPPIGGREM